MELPSPGPNSPASVLPADASSVHLASCEQSGVPSPGLRSHISARLRHTASNSTMLSESPNPAPTARLPGAGTGRGSPLGRTRRLGTNSHEKEKQAKPNSHCPQTSGLFSSTELLILGPQTIRYFTVLISEGQRVTKGRKTNALWPR